MYEDNDVRIREKYTTRYDTYNSTCNVHFARKLMTNGFTFADGGVVLYSLFVTCVFFFSFPGLVLVFSQMRTKK